MKKRFLHLLIIYTILLGLIACDRPECLNENPIFDQHDAHSKIYMDELAKELETIDSQKLTYWLKSYEEKEGKEYLHFHIQGEELCAVLVLEMQHWVKLLDVREKKGKHYIGSQFTKLEFEIRQQPTKTEFIYQSHGRIID